ncbi:DUF5658 family protein [Bacillus sp. CGMCC 1.16607]|uniref:DUF5658 family protein n=1 Tax=Bacillus sp. CGMCC 1.16607 TaxID=3351842 RepID=UPI00363A886E
MIIKPSLNFEKVDLTKLNKGVNVLTFMFIYLAFINIVDGLVTYIGLKLGNIEEANPLMSFLFDFDPILFISVKLGLSILLIMFIYLIKAPKSRVIHSLLVFSSMIYTFVCFKHLYWIALITNLT